VKVQYTVKCEYAGTNKANIRQVIADLQELDNPGIKYSPFVLEDGKTCLHFGVYSDLAAQEVVNNLPSFQFFRGQSGTTSNKRRPEPGGFRVRNFLKTSPNQSFLTKEYSFR
jgi:hypothetical protein